MARAQDGLDDVILLGGLTAASTFISLPQVAQRLGSSSHVRLTNRAQRWRLERSQASHPSPPPGQGGRTARPSISATRARKITVDPDGLMDPTVSPTLQNLVERIIYDPNKLVRITAMGKPDAGLLVDTFNANAGINPARTVQMLDFREVGKVSPHLATVFLSHVFAEYYQAARPRGRPPAQGNAAFNPAHRHAERVEAQVASELTGEALFANRTRNLAAPQANTFRASYGRNLWFVIRFQPGTRSINSISTSDALRKKWGGGRRVLSRDTTESAVTMRQLLAPATLPIGVGVVNVMRFARRPGAIHVR